MIQQKIWQEIVITILGKNGKKKGCVFMGLLNFLGDAVLSGTRAMIRYTEEHMPEMLEKQQRKTEAAYQNAYEAERTINRDRTCENYLNMEDARAHADEMSDRLDSMYRNAERFYEAKNKRNNNY